jgi:hypothetical protein
MIECIFTVDYEIYGNGSGSLKGLMYEPAEKLNALFRQFDSRFVLFVEAAELETIEKAGTDPDIDLVTRQVRRFHKEGHEIGLHMHPWWYNAEYESGNWLLDYSEYNLCTLPRDRIAELIERAIVYLRGLVGSSEFTPLSHRAGHLLFQPAEDAASVLSFWGIRIDSSVYKGGLWHQHKLDYRKALDNGSYWRFSEDVNVPDPEGDLIELPIHTRMVPTAAMLTSKRVKLQGKDASAVQAGKKIVSRLKNMMRFSYPLKLDFCSMTIDELTRTVDRVIQEDERDPASFRPVVAIGHTKDLVDFETVELFLSYLTRKGIAISTFEDIYPKCANHQFRSAVKGNVRV